MASGSALLVVEGKRNKVGHLPKVVYMSSGLARFDDVHFLRTVEDLNEPRSAVKCSQSI